MVNLVISRDKNCLFKNEENVFLGNWCYHNDNLIKSKVISSDFVKGDKEVDNDHKSIEKLQDNIFPELVKILNIHFNKNYSIRFYRILLEHWFNSFVEIIYTRTNQILKLSEKYENINCKIVSSEFFPLITYETLEFLKAEENDYWNQKLFSEIVSILNLPNIKQIKIEEIIKSPFLKKESSKNLLKNLIISINISFNNLISKNNKFFFKDTGFSKFEQFKINLKLGQFIFLNKNLPFFKKIDIDNELRENLKKELINSYSLHSISQVQKVLLSLLFKCIPVCYLEGLNSMEEELQKSFYPNKPKLIFTNTSYATDELFKLWTAQHTEKGCKYVISQHGAIGWKKKSFYEKEFNAADHFLSWGKNKLIENSIKSFCTKYNKIFNLKKRNNKNLVFLMAAYDTFQYRGLRSSILWRFDDSYDQYRKSVLKIYKNLQPEIKDRTIIRLYGWNDKYHWLKNMRTDLSFWQSQVSNKKIENQNKDIFRTFSNSRLLVHTYDSTTILESFVNNIPGIIIFNKHMYNQLNQDAKLNFDKLLSINILFLDYNKALNFINKNWNDINEWWHKDHVQKVIEEFCEEYSIKPENSIKDFTSLLDSKII